MTGPPYTAKDFIDAMPGTGGIKTAIARKVGCDWHTADKYIKTYPTVAQAYADECEGVLDLAESKLIQQVNNGEQWAVKYILSTKGKNRGFTERTEVTGADGQDIVLRVVYGDDGTKG